MSIEWRTEPARIADDGHRPGRMLATPANVIVAEDDDDLRVMVVSGLRQDGHQIVAVHDGVELLDYVASTMIHAEALAPDLIVTDIRMPGFSGMSVLAGLRDEAWAPPIIVMTAYSDSKTRRDAERLGALAFFAKPFDIDDLRTAVMNLLPLRPRRRPRRSSRPM